MKCGKYIVSNMKRLNFVQVPIRTHCDDIVTYHYGINGTYTSTTQNTSVIFYLDGYQNYNFVIKVENSVGCSEPEMETGRANQIGKYCSLNFFLVFLHQNTRVNETD